MIAFYEGAETKEVAASPSKIEVIKPELAKDSPYNILDLFDARFKIFNDEYQLAIDGLKAAISELNAILALPDAEFNERASKALAHASEISTFISAVAIKEEQAQITQKAVAKALGLNESADKLNEKIEAKLAEKFGLEKGANVAEQLLTNVSKASVAAVLKSDAAFKAAFDTAAKAGVKAAEGKSDLKAVAIENIKIAKLASTEAKALAAGKESEIKDAKAKLDEATKQLDENIKAQKAAQASAQAEAFKAAEADNKAVAEKGEVKLDDVKNLIKEAATGSVVDTNAPAKEEEKKPQDAAKGEEGAKPEASSTPAATPIKLIEVKPGDQTKDLSTFLSAISSEVSVMNSSGIKGSVSKDGSGFSWTPKDSAAKVSGIKGTTSVENLLKIAKDSAFSTFKAHLENGKINDNVINVATTDKSTIKVGAATLMFNDAATLDKLGALKADSDIQTLKDAQVSAVNEKPISGFNALTIDGKTFKISADLHLDKVLPLLAATTKDAAIAAAKAAGAVTVESAYDMSSKGTETLKTNANTSALKDGSVMQIKSGATAKGDLSKEGGKYVWTPEGSDFKIVGIKDSATLNDLVATTGASITFDKIAAIIEASGATLAGMAIDASSITIDGVELTLTVASAQLDKLAALTDSITAATLNAACVNKIGDSNTFANSKLTVDTKELEFSAGKELDLAKLSALTATSKLSELAAANVSKIGSGITIKAAGVLTVDSADLSLPETSTLAKVKALAANTPLSALAKAGVSKIGDNIEIKAADTIAIAGTNLKLPATATLTNIKGLSVISSTSDLATAGVTKVGDIDLTANNKITVHFMAKDSGAAAETDHALVLDLKDATHKLEDIKDLTMSSALSDLAVAGVSKVGDAITLNSETGLNITGITPALELAKTSTLEQIKDLKSSSKLAELKAAGVAKIGNDIEISTDSKHLKVAGVELTFDADKTLNDVKELAGTKSLTELKTAGVSKIGDMTLSIANSDPAKLSFALAEDKALDLSMPANKTLDNVKGIALSSKLSELNTAGVAKIDGNTLTDATTLTLKDSGPAIKFGAETTLDKVVGFSENTTLSALKAAGVTKVGDDAEITKEGYIKINGHELELNAQMSNDKPISGIVADLKATAKVDDLLTAGVVKVDGKINLVENAMTSGKATMTSETATPALTSDADKLYAFDFAISNGEKITFTHADTQIASFGTSDVSGSVSLTTSSSVAVSTNGIATITKGGSDNIDTLLEKLTADSHFNAAEHVYIAQASGESDGYLVYTGATAETSDDVVIHLTGLNSINATFAHGAADAHTTTIDFATQSS